MKQKSWWENQVSLPMGRKYRYDYIMALFMHSFSWAFMVMLPLTLTSNFIWWVFLLNIIIHFITDHLKANMKKINLITDQLIHIFQIIATYIICVVWL